MGTITATPGFRIRALSTHPYDQINLNNISQIIIWATVQSASSSILSSENETRWSPCASPSFTHLQALVLFGDDDNNCGVIVHFFTFIHYARFWSYSWFLLWHDHECGISSSACKVHSTSDVLLFVLFVVFIFNWMISRVLHITKTS